MAKLTSLRRNAERVNTGDWVTVGFEADDTFEIKTRGQTERFLYRYGELQRNAAREANRGLQPGQIPWTPDALPSPLSNRALGQAIHDEAFLDVRGLDGENGPVTADEFRKFLLQPLDYAALIGLAYGAMLRIHDERKEEAAAAVGNSAPVSAGV